MGIFTLHRISRNNTIPHLVSIQKKNDRFLGAFSLSISKVMVDVLQNLYQYIKNFLFQRRFQFQLIQFIFSKSQDTIKQLLRYSAFIGKYHIIMMHFLIILVYILHYKPLPCILNLFIIGPTQLYSLNIFKITAHFFPTIFSFGRQFRLSACTPASHKHYHDFSKSTSWVLFSNITPPLPGYRFYPGRIPLSTVVLS